MTAGPMKNRSDTDPMPSTDSEPVRPGPLAGVRVLDASTLFAGPFAARILGDFGADVIKVEHPRGDPSRHHGYAKEGQGLWWKTIGRNKRSMTLLLSTPSGQEVFRSMVRRADVVVENFRPGVMERWGLGYEELRAENPGIVMTRVTGFGQYGPYADRRGFGTLAEAMSGFASITGEPEGAPTLPPFGLADGVAGMAAAIGTLIALLRRTDADGRGQVVDVALIEPLMHLLGPHPTVYDQLGIVQQRTGNRSVNNAPRNTYRTADGKWLAVSTSANSIAERVMRLIGQDQVVDEPWFSSGGGRAQHADRLDAMVADWMRTRTQSEAMEAFVAAGAAVAPVYTIEDVMKDPQYRALESITTVDDPDLGPIAMHNQLFRLSDSPGAVRHTGQTLGQDTKTILTELGLSGSEIDRLRTEGAI